MKIYKPNGRCNISGTRIKAVREQLKLSQEQLAAKIQLEGLSITQKAISRIETGERVVADYELPYFSHALNLSIYSLLNLEEQ